MKKHIELRKAVIEKVRIFQQRQVYPSAKEVYQALRNMPQIRKRYTFKSFVRLMPTFPEVEKRPQARSNVIIYMLS